MCLGTSCSAGFEVFNKNTLQAALQLPKHHAKSEQEKGRHTEGKKGGSWELSGSIWESFHALEVRSIVHFAKRGVAITGANCSD